MLIKLLKYEFKDTARIIPLFYLVTLIFAGMVLLAKTLDIGWFRMTTSFLLLLLGIAVAVVTLVVIVMRFYKNLYSNEGYLMFTLPVKPHLLLASKGITAFCWMILSYCVSICSLFISLYGFGLTNELSAIQGELKKYGLENSLYLIIPLVILATVYLLSQIYFSITISNISMFNNLGPASAFLVFIVTYVVMQIIESLFTIFTPFSVEINLVGNIQASLTTKNMFGYLVDSIKGSEPTNVILGLGGYTFEVVAVVILFFIISRTMKNKVSLK